MTSLIQEGILPGGFSPLGRIDMKRVNLDQFYSFGHILHPIVDLRPGSPLKQYIYQLTWARYALGRFVTDMLIPMTICKTPAFKVLRAIDEMIGGSPEE